MWHPNAVIFLISLAIVTPATAQVGSQSVTASRRTVVPLKDDTGVTRFNLVVVGRAAGGVRPTIEDLQGNMLADLNSPPSLSGHDEIATVPDDDKADGATTTDIQGLQLQIDAIRKQLNQTIKTVNGLR